MATVTDTLKEKLVGFEAESPVGGETRASFMRHALKDNEGELYLDRSAFVDVIAPATEDYRKIKREQYELLFLVADRKRTGKVTLQDWSFFENLLNKPDAEYQIAFRLFDTRGEGLIKFDDFKQIYDQNKDPSSLPFDWNSEWASLYTGGRKKRHDLTYHQFSQLLRGLQGERVRQAFQHFDKNGDGYIEPEEFQKIVEGTAAHKLSDHILDNLHTLINATGGAKISYATVRAFQNIIQSMEQVEQIIRVAAKQSQDGTITREEFLNVSARSRRFSNFTPMETDILFHFAGMDSPSGRLGLNAFTKVLDSSWQTADRFEATGDSTAVDAGSSFAHQALESAHHFALGSIAGAFGAFMVYPIDLVKTRMQNQRGAVGNLLYKNSLDCASKVLKNEGFRGFYSGVSPQMIGVAPEKAIKLTVNDLVRGQFMDPDTKKVWYPYEALAGASAGGCQVVFTNPLEIVKIRLQVQGELAKTDTTTPRRSAIWIVKNLGLKGLYKGATACLARDIPFSAIYFPTYAHLKSDFFGESPTKKLGVLQLLTAGAIAGMPAAYLTTPFDVIKTRLQVEARQGDQVYTSLRHAAKLIYQQEGFKAFFKGGPARILRSSPQFGFTLAGYEVLQNLLPLPGHKSDIVSPDAVTMNESSAPLPYLRSRNALKILMDLDEGFGIPKLNKAAGWSTTFASK